MFESCLGIISFDDIGRKFGNLCKDRPAYMLPFAGRYRIVDFTLSNMINHGIRNIAVFTGEKIQSTLNHLGDGKPWDLNRRVGGLSIFPPLFDDKKRRRGDIYQYHVTREYFTNSKSEYVFIASPNVLAKVDLTEAFEYFLETDADITVLYKKQVNDSDDYINMEKLILADNGELINIGINLGSQPEFNLFMYMGFLKKEVFLEIVREGMETGKDLYLKQAIISKKESYKINSYEFEGHVEHIRGIRSYYNANMNLLNNEVFNKLFYQGGTILTKSEDEPSTFYIANPQVKNSLIANGCIIEGKVENSILFRGVKVGKNAVIKDSIIMQKSVIGEDVVLTNTILDKYVTVEKGTSIVGTKDNPYIGEKNSVI